jgi:hypothetical protein
LIEDMWTADSVGVIGGEPKTCKSFLALSMAISVAAGRPCLGRFHPKQPGRVLLFAAEDSLQMVRQRVDALCAHQGIAFSSLDLWVITAPSVRLDLANDRERLLRTIEVLKPTLLILDPFVRVHRVDENVSSAIVPLLAYLRELQRTHHCSVIVVHHAKKGASQQRAGQALRGSSEFHAWLDSGLFLKRKAERLQLNFEHRAHQALPPMNLRLVSKDKALALVVDQQTSGGSLDRPPAPSTSSQRDRLMACLASSSEPVTAEKLRNLCQMRTSNLFALLNKLKGEGLVVKTPKGWSIASAPVH